MSGRDEALPVIDVGALVTGRGDRDAVAAQIGAACRDKGFFYAVGHGVDRALQDRLEAASRAFFARDEAAKGAIAMDRGGRAWRGWFPLGGELTSGRPDHKEGLYFGAELSPDDPRVRAGTPLHGPNLFPPDGDLRDAVLAYLDALTGLGHALMAGIARSLGLADDYFHARYTRDPLILFRIFHYPPLPERGPDDEEAPRWSVGEHTDYGVLTILKQDERGGLQVRSGERWLDAPPLEDAFVCNIGDMLDRMTRGLYRSTSHRVRNPGNAARLSWPFFFDPAWDARVAPIDGVRSGSGDAASPGIADAATPGIDDAATRWDGVGVHDFEGTYGEYLLAKIGKVFPELRRDVL